jgi:hypothetical protein
MNTRTLTTLKALMLSLLVIMGDDARAQADPAPAPAMDLSAAITALGKAKKEYALQSSLLFRDKMLAQQAFMDQVPLQAALAEANEKIENDKQAALAKIEADKNAAIAAKPGDAKAKTDAEAAAAKATEAAEKTATDAIDAAAKDNEAKMAIPQQQISASNATESLLKAAIAKLKEAQEAYKVAFKAATGTDAPDEGMEVEELPEETETVVTPEQSLANAKTLLTMRTTEAANANKRAVDSKKTAEDFARQNKDSTDPDVLLKVEQTKKAAEAMAAIKVQADEALESAKAYLAAVTAQTAAAAGTTAATPGPR